MLAAPFAPLVSYDSDDRGELPGGVRCAGWAEANFDDVLARVAEQKVGMFALKWTMEYPSMESCLGPLYTSTGVANFAGYHNPSFDDLVTQGRQASSPEAAIPRYRSAEDLLGKDLPVLPLRYAQNNVAYSSKVADVHVDPFSRVDLLQIESAR